MDTPIFYIPITDFLTWLLFGFVVGIILHLIVPGDTKGGVLGTAIVGAIGSILGGLASVLFFGFGSDVFNAQNIAFVVGGSLIFGILERFLFRDKSQVKTRVTRLE